MAGLVWFDFQIDIRYNFGGPRGLYQHIQDSNVGNIKRLGLKGESKKQSLEVGFMFYLKISYKLL